MGLENRRILFVTCAILVVASVLYITANALPMWGNISGESGTATYGLWKSCGTANGKTVCLDWPSNSDGKNLSARSFVTICCILCALSVLSLLAILFVEENFKSKIILLGKGLAIASLISGIIGVALGISFGMKPVGLVDAKIGVSSILGIIAVGFNLGGVITTFIMK